MARTTLPWPSYQRLANEYYSQGIKPAAIKEILGEPIWEGESWHIKPSGSGGISRQRLDSRQKNKAKSDAERVSQSKIQTVGEKSFGSKIKGLEAHHLRMLSLYAPLFKGASEADQVKLAQHAVNVGIPLGDVEANRGDLPSSVHNNLHNYQRKHGLTGKSMPDFSNADLDNRIKAFDVLYKDFLQPDIDSKTISLMQDYRSKHPDKYQQKYTIGEMVFAGAQLLADTSKSPIVDAAVGAFSDVDEMVKQETGQRIFDAIPDPRISAKQKKKDNLLINQAAERTAAQGPSNAFNDAVEDAAEFINDKVKTLFFPGAPLELPDTTL